MKDKMLIFQSPLCDFSVSPWGVLKFQQPGIFELDERKAFNRARRMLNVGANMFRILRSANYGVTAGQEFDWTDPLYFPILTKYVKILHQPVQGKPIGQGARVLIEPYNGCSEKWMYSDYALAKKLLRAFLEWKKRENLTFVDIGAGNEMNSEKQSVPFFKNVIVPTFDDFDLIPFSYGATYSIKHGDKMIVGQKQEASKKWGDATSFAIYKQVHGCCDNNSPDFLQARDFWAKHPMCTFFSVDGCKNGKSPCDFYQDQVRPSPLEFLETLKSLIDFVKTMNNPAFLLRTGQPKFAMEFISKVWNNDQCGALPIIAVSELYNTTFGKYPDNWGKYPNDWIEPPTPPPPSPPEPPTPPVVIKPCSYFWNRHNYKHWLRCIFCGKH